MEHETFWTLLQDPAHWYFELFLILLVDGLILGLIWPKLRKWKKHHKEDDDKLESLQKQVDDIKKHLVI